MAEASQTPSDNMHNMPPFVTIGGKKPSIAAPSATVGGDFESPDQSRAPTFAAESTAGDTKSSSKDHAQGVKQPKNGPFSNVAVHGSDADVPAPLAGQFQHHNHHHAPHQDEWQPHQTHISGSKEEESKGSGDKDEESQQERVGEDVFVEQQKVLKEKEKLD